MDRQVVYSGQIPLEVHILNTNKYTMLGLSRLAEAMLGRSNVWVTGLLATADLVQAFHVSVSAGQIYQLAPIDATAYGGVLAPDATQILKQGTSDSALDFATPKPSSGQSIYYLISAAYVESDDQADVLLYYNAANPEEAFSGPNGNGAAQATRRAGRCVVQMTTGTAATSGTETVPATPAGFTALWTVRVSGNTVSLTNASSATTDGIWKVGSSHFIQFGGTGDLTQANADLRYAQLAAANAFTNRQSINFNDPIAIDIFGSSNAAGVGIRMTGDGVTTPSKRITVRGGSLAILNDAGSSTAIMLLSDAGNLSCTGTLTAGGKITAGATATNALDVVTLAFADARYAAAGASGFITQATADGRYVMLSNTSIQTLTGQLFVPTQPTSGTVPANQLITQGYADSHYVTAALSGIPQATADGRYLMLDSSGVAKTVLTPTTFSAALTLSTNPTLSGHAVPLGFADARYSQLNAAVTHTQQVSGIAAVADANFTTRGFSDARYLQLGGSQQSVTKVVAFSTFPTVPTSGATGGQVVSAAQMAAAITSGQGITQAFADGRYAQLAGSNSFSGSNTFSNVITCLTNAFSNQHVLTLGDASSRFATLAGPTFTDVPKGPGGSASVTNGYVTWQQVFGGGGGGFATLGANTFTGTQTINPAAGDCLVLGTSASGKSAITMPGGGKFGYNNATGNFNVWGPSGQAMLFVNLTTGDLSVGPTGSMLVGGNLTVSGTAGSTFSGPVAVGVPTQGGHATRQDQFTHQGNSTTGHIELPNGYIINFGTVTMTGGATSQSVSFHRPFTSVALACVACPVSSAVGCVAFSLSNGGCSVGAAVSNQTVRFIAIGK